MPVTLLSGEESHGTGSTYNLLLLPWSKILGDFLRYHMVHLESFSTIHLCGVRTGPRTALGCSVPKMCTHKKSPTFGLVDDTSLCEWFVHHAS